MRPIIKIKEQEVKITKSDFQTKFNQIVEDLFEYLNTWIHKDAPNKGVETTSYKSFSKYSVMGPVGKLLSAIEGEKFDDLNALEGYIINIHNNTAKYPIKRQGSKHLENAISLLSELKTEISLRKWIRTIREIDYAIYKKKMKLISERAVAKKEKGESNE